MVLDMNFDWLKRYMPRGIYGRAALILILPVVTLQLVVSVVFIQRHFEGVTEQLTGNLVRELNLVLDEMNAYNTPTAALVGTRELTQGLDLNVAFDPGAFSGSLRRWFDFSGIIVTRELKNRVPGVYAVQLPDDRSVTPSK